MTSAPPHPSPPDDPAAAIQAKQAALLQQCPAPVTPHDAATLPINVLRWGGAGARVLIIHGGVQGGLGGGASTFAKQQPLASLGWQLELVERPGFGQSPSRGPEDMEADAVWIADMLGDGAHIIGHSWGGAEAMLAAARRPDAVRSLILIEPALQPLLLGSPRVGADPALRVSAEAFGGIIMKAQTPGEYALGFGGLLGAADPDNAGGTAMGGLQRDPERAARFGCSLLRARVAPLRCCARARRASRRPRSPCSSSRHPTTSSSCRARPRSTWRSTRSCVRLLRVARPRPARNRGGPSATGMGAKGTTARR